MEFFLPKIYNGVTKSPEDCEKMEELFLPFPLKKVQNAGKTPLFHGPGVDGGTKKRYDMKR